MKNFRTYTGPLLEETVCRFHLLTDSERALVKKTAERIINIRRQIYEKADALGYVQRCIRAIPDCRGECCKWHFPKNLGLADMAVTICSVSPDKLNVLKKRLRRHDGKNQCPVLGTGGCALSYESRPTVCAVSYPCFAGDAYHAYVRQKQIEIDRLCSVLNTLFQKEKRVPGGHAHENQV